MRVLSAIIWSAGFYGGLLFIPAGSMHWWRAWVATALTVIAGILSMLALRGHEDLLRERFKSPIQTGQPLADKVVILVLIFSYTFSILFIGIDRFHLHLLPAVPDWLSAAGLVLFLMGWAIEAAAMRQNTFAAPVVRHQAERQQHVVDSGLYAIARHPMYAGAIPLFLGLPLWLQSYAGAAATLVPLASMVIRIHIEERLLKQALPGYEAYMHKVRYRLIPGIW